MDSLTESLLWCIAQVTLVALLAWLMCVAIRRGKDPGSAIVPATALAAVVVLTVCAFLPWPQAWRYGPRWHAPSVATATDLVPARDATPLPDHAHDSSNATSMTTFDDPRFEFTPEPSSDGNSLSSALPSPVPTTPAVAVEPDGTMLLRRWLPNLLAAGLACGAVLGLMQLAGGLLSVRAHRRRSQPLDHAELLELVDCLRAELCLTRRVELRECGELATAATIGWKQPVILLPPSWREWTDDQRRAVFAHELAHVARGDYLTCVLAQFSLAVHFYHPLVHWLTARLRLEQELAADATAAALSGGRRNYLQSLAELALHSSERSLGWPAHTFLPTQGTFLRRIEMLRDSQSASPAVRPRGMIRWSAVGLLIVGAVAIAGLRGGPGASPFDNAAHAQQSAGEQADSKSPAGVDLTYVNNDAKMLLAIRVAEVAKVPEIREALGGMTHEGPSPLTLLTLDGIEQLTLIGLGGLEPDDWGRDSRIVVLQFGKPTSYDEIAKAGAWPADAPRLPGRVDANVPGAPLRQAYGLVNERTFVLGSSESVGRYMANRRKGQPAIAGGAAWDKVRTGAIVAALDMEIVRDTMRRRPVGADAAIALAPLWTDSEYLLSGILIEGKTVHLRAIATCDNGELAEQVAETVTAGATLARNLLRAVRDKQPDIPAYARLAMEAGDGLLKAVKVERMDSLVVVQTNTELPKAAVTAAGSLTGAISQARGAAQNAQSMNNLKQIMLGMHNWADTYGNRFPPPVIMGKDGKGKVPHSWRIELLPYMGQEALYRQYHFDEPWDSDANKRVLTQMPAVFRHPQDDPKSTNSSYYVLRSEKLLDETPAPGGGFTAPDGGFPTAFSARNGIPFSLIWDGTSNTLAVVEAKRDTPWTKPEDILFDPAKDPPKLGGYGKEGFHVGICDGSVRALPYQFDPKILKLLVIPGDGNPLPRF